MKLSEAGFMHVGFAAVLVLCICSSVFMLGTLIRWRQTVELQRRLDRCVAHTALGLKKSLKQVETLNLSIQATRVSIAAASGLPPVAAALQATLGAQVLIQETVLRAWDLKRLSWLAKRGCDSKWDLALPLPGQPWIRDLPDSIGPQALKWTGEEPRELSILLRRGARASAARVENQSAGGNQSEWKARWASGFSGAGLN